MNRVIPQYAAFSDESRYTEGRFRSIAAVSLPAASVVAVSDRMRALLRERGVREFKWHDLGNEKHRGAAEALVDYLFDELLGAELRVDVLTWDIEDSRNRVANRDDLANYARMFFHLHRVLMQRREAGAHWHLRPDEGVNVDWETIQSCLASVGAWRRYFEHPLLKESFSERFFNVRSLRRVDSADTPLCQLADFFAGIAPYSRLKAETILRWLRVSAGQLDLFERKPIHPGRRDSARLPVLKHLYDRCKRARLGVSLASAGYLRTLDPSRPLNFWHYAPQHEQDKAPTKDRRLAAAGPSKPPPPPV